MADQARARSGHPGGELPLFAGVEVPVPAVRRARASPDGRARTRTAANAGDSARLLTIGQVCDRLQCGRTYVYALLERRALRAVKLGRLRRIPLSELEDFIARRVAAAEDDAGGPQTRSSVSPLGPP